MRFHIGFSKFVKPGKLFKWLGIGFLLLLSLVSCESVNADTLNHFDFYDPNNWGTYNAILEGSYTYAMTTSPDTDIYVSDVPLYQYEIWQGGSLRDRFFCFSSTCDNTQSLFGYTYNASMYNYQGDSMRVFKNASFGYSNENYCDVNDYKSNELYVYLSYGFDSYFTSFMNNNNFTPGDIWEMKFNAIDSNGDYYVTYCSYIGEQIINSGTSEAIYNCPYTFIGNSNITVDRYSIDVFNKLSQDGDYILSGTYNYLLTNLSIDLINTTYQCSSNEPTIDFTTGDLSDPETEIDWPKLNTGLENGLTNPYSGFDFTPMEVELPQNVQELLSLPLFVVDSIIRNSTTCTPYEIDFSPIVKKWGDLNGSYVLTLPCMRNYLSNLLSTPSFNLYYLIDVLLAAIVFYNLALYVIQFIDAITSGVDMYTWYFTRSDKRDGHKINHATGEVG